MSFLKKLSPLAIIVGIIVDMVGTMIASTLFALIYVFTNHIDINNIRSIYTDNYFLVAGMAIGAAFSVLGGYVAARMATKSKLLNAAVIGLICELSGLVSVLGGKSVLPTWYQIVAFFITIPIIMFGGYLALKVKKMERNLPVE